MSIRRAGAIAAIGISVILSVPIAQGSSAVAVALNPKSGRLSFAFSKTEATESEARKRAIRYCRSMGWLHPSVIHSTNREGFGAIVSFDKGDNKAHFAASLAAETTKQAITGALKNAKAAGGYYATVETVFSDGGSETIDLRKRWPRGW
jgi:hypothetical protein